MSDEEAKEVVRLLSPTVEHESDWDGHCDWASSNSVESAKTTEDHSKMVASMEDSFVSTRRGSHSESESGHMGSVSSLGEQVLKPLLS